MAPKSAKIIELKEMIGETGIIIIEQVGIAPLMELREELETLEDTWFEPYVEHLLSDIVMITLLAVMAQANAWNEITEFARIALAKGHLSLKAAFSRYQNPPPLGGGRLVKTPSG